jgi:hypothetical protein
MDDDYTNRYSTDQATRIFCSPGLDSKKVLRRVGEIPTRIMLKQKQAICRFCGKSQILAGLTG